MKKTHELLVVHGLDGLLSRGLLGKGNKAKATRATRARLTVAWVGGVSKR